MQPYVTTSGLLALLIPLMAAAILLFLSRLVRERHRGWRHISPGLGYWLALSLGASLAVLITWVWAFVGSSRQDGEVQMRIAWWLAFVFSLMAGWCSWRVLALERHAVRWRGDTLVWRQAGALSERALLGANGLKSGFGGKAVVSFTNGERLVLDMAASNASELIARIEELNDLADPDAPPEH